MNVDGHSALDEGQGEIEVLGMTAAQVDMSTIADNLTKIGVNGYKAVRTQTQDAGHITHMNAGAMQDAGGTALPTNLQYGLGVRIIGITRIMTDGISERECNNLPELHKSLRDLVILGSTSTSDSD